MKAAEEFWQDVQFELFVVLWRLGVFGLVLVGISLLLRTPRLAGLGLLLLIPVLFHATLLTIWHWKSRYKGDHSKLWGVLLMCDRSGSMQAIYFFRHVLPDRRGRGRYALDATMPAVSV